MNTDASRPRRGPAGTRQTPSEAEGGWTEVSRPPEKVILDKELIGRHIPPRSAEVAELVDALGSGSSWGSPVEVRVFSSAPFNRQRSALLLLTRSPMREAGFFCDKNEENEQVAKLRKPSAMVMELFIDKQTASICEVKK